MSPIRADPETLTSAKAALLKATRAVLVKRVCFIVSSFSFVVSYPKTLRKDVGVWASFFLELLFEATETGACRDQATNDHVLL
jgi:hypothetical protein